MPDSPGWHVWSPRVEGGVMTITVQVHPRHGGPHAHYFPADVEGCF